MQRPADRTKSHDIVLTTANARYSHTAFGLRWLWAGLGPLRERAAIREFTLNQSPLEIAEALLIHQPRIIGLGAYIWNVTLLTQVVQTIKGVRPDVVIVLGGPEASFEYEGTDLFASADYLIRGEGEVAFARLAEAILRGDHPAGKVVTAERPDLASVPLPYDAYTDEDIAQRLIYVEATRGCPFRCDFCLSSLDPEVREFPLDGFLDAMARLIDRGVRQFKFVDRTFNLDRDRVDAILRFFQEHWRDGMRLHFEILPDLLSERMLERIAQFPVGGLHLEAGVQSINPEILGAVSRRQNIEKTVANLRFLRTQTGALIHVDLIVGLPGESWDSVAAGFDRLVPIAPHALQVGILKRLKGTRIARHAQAHALVFAPHPPYEILQTGLLTFEQMQRLKRFARYFDLYYNSGNFPNTLPLLWRTRPSPFAAFMNLSDFLWAATGRTHEFPLVELARRLYGFLIQAKPDDPQPIADAIKQDLNRVPGRKDKLDFLL